MEKDELFKEIDLIQNCINRMAKNSFMLKGWALTIFAGVTAFTKGENFSNPVTLVCTTIIPFVCFWILDTFFLRTEKKYRKMYEDMLIKRKDNNTEGQYELNPPKIKVDCFLKVMFSITLVVFYGIPLLASIFLLVISIKHNYVCI
ncbi:hypothetical protein QVO10_08565 [Bacteroides gallinaceum]|jgi:hypothetical protein|uniref:TMhelix containing protein n=1 Tax=Bacteroides gallinaceum TaxID=1462571 RepID=A0ABT7X5R7_9BACE|nr:MULTISPECIES: hypothetical protein [Bacteroides]MBV4091683.1 hypothetical protein [Bacteroides thetaiotaomicron]MBV4103309.1 hypothetical protein [Bacteroides thetaiotaomicron]MBV4139151.1 hypothetical protein [Bacteroides thetaiotaomicron]MDN0049437.1 hypothetical protein [Bacteroides gallinaceum]